MDRLEILKAEYSELNQKLEQPGVHATPDYPKLAKRQAELTKIIEFSNRVDELNQKIEHTCEKDHRQTGWLHRHQLQP